MTLFDELNSISNLIETIFGIELTEKDFEDGREELLHVFLYEACHAAIAHCVPWIHELSEREHTAVDEIMVRFLEMEICASLGLFVHTDQGFLDELAFYSVVLTTPEFEHLKELWQAYFWPKRDLAGMATYLLTFLRHGCVIYHILPHEDWQKARKNGIYTPTSLETEGFIHCSDIDQVLGSANAYFAGESDLRLLCIAVEKVFPEIRYEGATAEHPRGFPHIYGPLRLEVVVNVSTLSPDDRGDFVLPKYPQALVAPGSIA